MGESCHDPGSINRAKELNISDSPHDEDEVDEEEPIATDAPGT